MAVQIETRGQLQDFLDVLKRRAWQVILPATFVIALGVSFAVIVPKKYLARTQLELRPIGVSVSSKEGANASFQIRAPARIHKVVETLNNPEYLSLPPDEQRVFLEDTKDDTKVELGRGTDQGTNFVTITFAAIDPAWAVNFLEALTKDWTDDVLERDRAKVEDERAKLQGEKDKLQREYSAAESDLAEIERANGISPTQPIPSMTGPRTEDPDYTRLQSWKTQLGETVQKLATADAKVVHLEQRLAAAPEFMAHEQTVAGNTNQADLKQIELDLVDATKKLETFKEPNSKYKLLRKKIDDLEAKRDELYRLVTSGETTSVKTPNPARAEIRKELDAARFEAASLRGTQTALKQNIEEAEGKVELVHDVYRKIREKEQAIAQLKAALTSAEADYFKKEQLAQNVRGPLANPFSILEPVRVPRRPTEPNPWIIIAFSIVAGLATGVGLAVVLEYSRNCFRSVYDISRVMVVPVLGSVNTIVTRKEARVRQVRSTLVGASSALIIGSLVFVTWAWAKSPELLSPDLRDAIENLRSKLK